VECPFCGGLGIDTDARLPYAMCLQCGGTGTDARYENAELGFGFLDDDDVADVEYFHLTGRVLA
jgi:hypothetical protein